MERKPNLFIIGAPKCGTTALATWLSGHPEIFFSRSKEPHFFSSDYKLTETLDDYLKFFSASCDSDKFLAEASVWYMHSSTAVENILKFNKNSRFLVMLRNPVEMVFSMHQQQLFNGNELIRDVSRAIEKSDERLAGVSVGVRAGYPPKHLAYLKSCALSWQLERVMQAVPSDQLHIVLHDDLKGEPQTTYGKVLDFLDVEPFYPESFEHINKARVRRSFVLDSLVLKMVSIKAAIGVRRSLGVMSSLRRWNQKLAPPKKFEAPTKALLCDYFQSDVQKLERLLGRDLSGWIDR
tara:strand:- start:1085 stop:1966 length:882 start_codon:yes stop_codon:yes gene_type:complete